MHAGGGHGEQALAALPALEPGAALRGEGGLLQQLEAGALADAAATLCQQQQQQAPSAQPAPGP